MAESVGRLQGAGACLEEVSGGSEGQSADDAQGADMQRCWIRNIVVLVSARLGFAFTLSILDAPTSSPLPVHVQTHRGYPAVHDKPPSLREHPCANIRAVGTSECRGLHLVLIVRIIVVFITAVARIIISVPR